MGILRMDGQMTLRAWLGPRILLRKLNRKLALHHHFCLLAYCLAARTPTSGVGSGWMGMDPTKPWSLYVFYLMERYSFSHCSFRSQLRPFVQVLPYCFRPHSTHLCQPLDVVLFGPTQKEYGLLVLDEVRRGNKVRKEDFSR